MDRDEGVGAIVFAGEKLPELEGFEFLEKTRLLGRDFLFRGGLGGRLGFLGGQFLERFEISELALEFEHGIDQSAQSRDLLDIGLGAFAVRPEIGRRHPGFELGQAGLEFWQVKETSAVRRRGRAILLR